MTSDHEKPRSAATRGRTNPFRRYRNITPLAPQEAQRQGAISALAFQLLGGRDAALDFLNSDHALLDGRPIAVATQSAAGYARVERELRAQSLDHAASHGG